MGNCSTITEFLLKAFADDCGMQVLHCVMFLFVYLAGVVGNLLIIAAVAFDQHLHSPMYFFLVNLSFLDVCYISTTVPKSIAISITTKKNISFVGYVAQVFLVVTSVGGEFSLLTIMAHDRYVAICHPLQYIVIMNWNACIQMAAAAWIISLMHAVLQSCLTFRVNFCGPNTVEQFFCDMPHLQKISCTDPTVHNIIIWVIGPIVVLFCFSLIFACYGYIFSTVMKIPSVQARYKAFSTCTPFLTVFILFTFTAIFSYLIPTTLSSPFMDLVSACLYTILPPVLNPLIYSLRNKAIRESVWKISPRLKLFWG